MSREIALDSPAATVARRQPLLPTDLRISTPKKHRAVAKSGGGSCRRSRMGETAGECAAVCCCCPCAMVHLLILAVYRLPRGIWRKKKKRMLLRKKRRISSEENRKSNAIVSKGADEAEESTEDEDCEGQNDAVDWDNEMWDRFYGAGFWRSASRRNDDDD